MPYVKNMPSYYIRKEWSGDWRIWIVSPHTGDLKECVGMFDTKRQAEAALRKLENN